MAEIYVSLEGFGTAKLALDLVEDYSETDGIEVWRGVFSDSLEQDEVLWEVYFEMNATDGYEAWDLVNEAIYTYRTETEEYD